MANIVIKNLTESIDLDRQAMTAISGGARLRGAKAMFAAAGGQSGRLVEFPPGFKAGAAPVGGRPAVPPIGGKLSK